jgi:hypothetical protein
MQGDVSSQITLTEAEMRISWNVPIYKHHGILAGFAAYKNHVSFGFGAAVLQSKDRKMLEEKGLQNRKRNHANQVRPKSADHNDKENSKSKNE